MAASRRRFKSFNPTRIGLGQHFRLIATGPSRVIITCPNCQTRYKLGTDALNAAGRQVQCAACSELWYATPGFPEPAAATPAAKIRISVNGMSVGSKSASPSRAGTGDRTMWLRDVPQRKTAGHKPGRLA